jgi:hypothetical protein
LSQQWFQNNTSERLAFGSDLPQNKKALVFGSPKLKSPMEGDSPLKRTTLDETPLTKYVQPKEPYSWHIGDSYTPELPSQDVYMFMASSQNNGTMRLVCMLKHQFLAKYNRDVTLSADREEYHVTFENDLHCYWRMEKISFHPMQPMSLEQRIQTFVNSPQRISKRSRELAYTGMYYTGVEDRARCYILVRWKLRV